MTRYVSEDSAGSIQAPPDAAIYSYEVKLRYSEHIPLGANDSSGVDSEWIDVRQDAVVVEFNLPTPRYEESGGSLITCKVRLWDKSNRSSIVCSGVEEFTTQFKPGEDGRKCLVIRDFDSVHRNPETGLPRCLYSIWLDSEDVNAEVTVSLWA